MDFWNFRTLEYQYDKILQLFSVSGTQGIKKIKKYRDFGKTWGKKPITRAFAMRAKNTMVEFWPGLLIKGNGNVSNRRHAKIP